MVFFSEMVILVVFNSFNVVKNLKKPDLVARQKPPFYTTIRSLKAKYRNNVAQKIIQSVEKKKTLPKISLLQGMQMLVSAWNALSTQTIVN